MADTREPSPRSQQVYKGGKKEKDKKDKTKTKGQQLEKSGEYIDTGELDTKGNPLLIKRDSTVQQGINRDKTKNKDFDQILNPDGSYRRPSLGQLREGVDWKKRANQLLMIGAGGAAIIGEGMKSLLINPYRGI